MTDQNNNLGNNSRVPTASRHLILIRHGQYNLAGSTDSDRYLTDLGREQVGELEGEIYEDQNILKSFRQNIQEFA